MKTRTIKIIDCILIIFCLTMICLIFTCNPAPAQTIDSIGWKKICENNIVHFQSGDKEVIYFQDYFICEKDTNVLHAYHVGPPYCDSTGDCLKQRFFFENSPRSKGKRLCRSLGCFGK